jgi:hypothetical protein
MTDNNKEQLLYFVTRPSMYIRPMEASSAINFVSGFEAGMGEKASFIEALSQLLSEKYKVNGGCLGWPEQVRLLAKKRSLSWLTTFRRLVPEIVAETQEGKLTHAQQVILRKKISGWIDRVKSTGDPWFSADWPKEWQALCAMKSPWFKQLWSRKEWAVIRAIDKLVQADCLFCDEERRLPSPALMQLKEIYIKVASANKASEGVD